MSNENKIIRTRFAPSPTGMVHIGSVRTALFNFLYSKKMGGVVVLRVEDTDQSRKVEGAVENMIKVMKTLGIIFDEGPTLTDSGELSEQGNFGPYTQSHRIEKYEKYAQQLLENKSAYYCFCSQERLDELRKEQIALKQPAMYDRHCKKFSAEEVEVKLAEFASEGKRPVVRQAIPEQGSTIVKDIVYGDITYEHSTIDDQVLLKSDGFPTYHLAVVVDDHEMEITHVIRGEEWLPSTPKHVLLYGAFGWQPTAFAHMPLILNPDKSKLSKRQGDVAAEEFLAKGYLPEALVNFVALLGWNPKTEQELFDMNGLIAEFELSKINKGGSVLDMNKLDWMNGMYIRAKSNEQLLELLTPYLIKQGIDTSSLPQEFLLKVVEIEKERLKNLSQITEETDFYFNEPSYEAEALVWKKADKEDAKAKLVAIAGWLETLGEADFDKAILETKTKQWITEQGFETGNVLWPLRVALTGLPKSPSPFEVAGCLVLNGGRETIISRIKKAIEIL